SKAADDRGTIGAAPSTTRSTDSPVVKGRSSSSRNSDDQERQSNDDLAGVLDADHLAELGDGLYRKHSAQLEKQHFGQYVIFNIENGKYVIGASHLDAIKAFRAEHAHAP